MVLMLLTYTVVNGLISLAAYKVNENKNYARLAAIVLAVLAMVNMGDYRLLFTGLIDLLILEIYFYKTKTIN